jgi:hypothetical protein
MSAQPGVARQSFCTFARRDFDVPDDLAIDYRKEPRPVGAN